MLHAVSKKINCMFSELESFLKFTTVINMLPPKQIVVEVVESTSIFGLLSRVAQHRTRHK